MDVMYGVLKNYKFMYLEIDREKKRGYIKFSWKEIWVLIKKRRLLLTAETIGLITKDFLDMTIQLQKIKDKKDSKKQ